jgi:hypothetical protein
MTVHRFFSSTGFGLGSATYGGNVIDARGLLSGVAENLSLPIRFGLTEILLEPLRPQPTLVSTALFSPGKVLVENATLLSLFTEEDL